MGELIPAAHAVSIRAPARGATGGTVLDSSNAVQFLSAPPHGGRRRALRRLHRSGSSFYPRPRTGGDENAASIFFRDESFYPRPRTGGDTEQRRAQLSDGVSIRAPARGATSRTSSGGYRHESFYPRPRTGGDAEGNDHRQR